MPNFSNGKLDLIVGCMYSGKTINLLGRLVVCADLGLKVLYINHSLDDRNPGYSISTHNPLISLENNKIDSISVSTLKGLRKEEYDVIGIDEAQFFDISLYNFCKTHVEVYKRHVIVSGLDSDSNRNKFGHIIDLIPLADSIHKMRAFCDECGPRKTKALFSYKTVMNDNIIDVGGKNKYIPLCRECYLNKA